MSLDFIDEVVDVQCNMSYYSHQKVSSELSIIILINYDKRITQANEIE